MNIASRRLLTIPCNLLCKQTAPKCLPRMLQNLTSPCLIDVRNYCEEKVETKSLPTLMEFPPIVWPSFIKFVKNWMFANFIIKPYFDNEFNLHEFIDASKTAVKVVSEALQNNDFKSLDGLVDKDAITKLKTAVSKLNVSQRHLLGVAEEDIFYAFPYQIGVIFDESDKRWVEITMCYHVLRGLKQIIDSGDAPPISIGLQPEYQDKFFILNYRFIKEFTKGVEDSWWVNIVNHFQPHALIK